MLVSIPHPLSVEPRQGTLALEHVTQIFLPPDYGELDIEAARLLQEEIRRCAGCSLPISCAWRPASTSGVVAIGDPSSLAAAFGDRMPSLPAVPDDPEGYAFDISEHAVVIAAAEPRGRLWAVQTLRQIIRLHGAKVPHMRVSDKPAMSVRGIMLDVSRGKVPQLETLKALVDTLSLLKLNMLQLYVEHTFQFPRHPRIGYGCGSLSCEDMLALDAHCKRRGLELVPQLQSFGHMRNILKLDDYRHLAEHPETLWSLCPTDPASLRLMDELYEEYLPCFSSDYINIASDETHDLGKPGGRSEAVIAEKGKGRVYLDFVLGLYRLLTEKFGKRVMCWGDILLQHPELVPELPKDLIVLNWDYADRERFEQVKVFAESGLRQIICPGTNSWNTVVPRINMAWTNVANFVRDGKAAGALGMLNTDWGDGGHYNLLGNSYYSYAHGAETSWAEEPLPRPTFEAVLGAAIFGNSGEQVVSAIRELGSVADQPALYKGNSSLTMAMLFSSPLEDERLRALPSEVMQSAIATAIEAGTDLHHAVLDSYEPLAVTEMAWAADALAYAARKTDFFQRVLALPAGHEAVDELIATAEDLVAEHEVTVTAFRERWYATNRHSEIDISLHRFNHAAEVLHTVHQWLQDHREALAAGETAPLPELTAGTRK